MAAAFKAKMVLRALGEDGKWEEKTQDLTDIFLLDQLSVSKLEELSRQEITRSGEVVEKTIWAKLQSSKPAAPVKPAAKARRRQ